MTDVAALGISIDSDGVLAGDAALEGFAKAADQASASAEKVEAAAKRGGRGAGELGSGARQAMQALDALAKVESTTASRAVEMAEAAQRAGASAAAATGGVSGLAGGFDILTGKLNTNFVAINKNLQQLGLLPGALKQATTAANDNAAAMQSNVGNIAAQFQDIGVTAAMGMSPMLIALQQGTQLSAVFAQSGVSAGAALVGAFKSVVSPVSLLTIGIVALVAYIIQYGVEALSASSKTDQLAKALDNAKLSSSNLADGQSILGEVFDLTTGKIKDQTDATMALARAMAMQSKIQAQIRQQQASDQLDSMAREKWGVTGGMGGGIQVQRFYGATAGVVDAFKSGAYGKDGATVAQKQLERMVKLGQATKEEYLAASSAIANFAVEAANVARSDDMLAALGGDKGALEQFLNRPDPKKDRHAESLAREMKATEELIDGLYRSAAAYDVSTAAGVRAQVEAEALAKGIQKQADLQAYAAQQLRKYVAEQVQATAQQAATLNDQTRAQEFVNKAVRSGALDADKAADALSNMVDQQKLMTAMAVAQSNGDQRGYEAARKALQALTEAQIANNKARRDAADLQQAAQIDRSIEGVKLETKLQMDLGAARIAAMAGPSGATLEEELARIAGQHEKIAIQARAEAEAARLTKAGYDDAAAAVLRKAEADKTQVDARYEIERQTAAIDRYNDMLRETVDLLSGLGSIGQVLGGIMGVVTGNTGAITGRLGDLLNVGVITKDRDGRQIASTIGAELTKVFRKDGAFAKGLAFVLQNATTGMTAAASILGKQSKSEQAGSAVGGALGGKLGEKFLSKGLETISKGLGKFAGPLGAVAGGIIGSVVGGLFKKVKWGRVDLTSGGVSGTSGNSSSSEKAALAAGNSIMGGLRDLAMQLGGSIGDFGSISVGVRHGDYRVNTGGTSLKVKKGAIDFDDDASAAIAFAMKEAIERGAINGIRESTNNLLKAGDDLQAQLQKALTFEGVFSELKSYTDPVGAELDTINRKFDQLRVIFKEAGASAEEYAQLEQLLTIQRQQAMQKESDALDDVRSRIAEAQGDDATVKAIERAHELRDAMSDQVRAELQRLYAVEDATEAQQKLADAQQAAATAAEQLRDTWKSIGADLLDEINRIRGLTGSEQGADFAKLQGRFNSTLAAARAGDTDAASKLVDLSQSLLTAAGNTATSRQELDRIKAQTAAGLESLYNQIGSAGAPAAGSSSPFPTSETSSSTGAGGSTGSSEVAQLRDEIAQLRKELSNALATIAGNTGRSAKVLENVSSASGGDAISVAKAA